MDWGVAEFCEVDLGILRKAMEIYRQENVAFDVLRYDYC